MAEGAEEEVTAGGGSTGALASGAFFCCSHSSRTGTTGEGRMPCNRSTAGGITEGAVLLRGQLCY